jgi:hypothetical protein
MLTQLKRNHARLNKHHCFTFEIRPNIPCCPKHFKFLKSEKVENPGNTLSGHLERQGLFSMLSKDTLPNIMVCMLGKLKYD